MDDRPRTQIKAAGNVKPAWIHKNMKMLYHKSQSVSHVVIHSRLGGMDIASGQDAWDSEWSETGDCLGRTSRTDQSGTELKHIATAVTIDSHCLPSHYPKPFLLLLLYSINRGGTSRKACTCIEFSDPLYKYMVSDMRVVLSYQCTSSLFPGFLI